MAVPLLFLGNALHASATMKRAEHPSPVHSPSSLKDFSFDNNAGTGSGESEVEKANSWTKVEKRKLKKAKKVEASQEVRSSLVFMSVLYRLIQ